MKLLFDLFPVILFFVAFKLVDIYAATGVAILASIGQILWLKFRGRRVEPMQWAGLVIIIVFGGMTLVFRDETFIKWKPTVLYLALSFALVVARFGFRRNLIEKMMGAQISLPAAIWDRLNLAWMLFFVGMAGLNLYVAHTYPTDVWVNFKLFGTMGLTIAFVVAQALYMGRFIREDDRS